MWAFRFGGQHHGEQSKETKAQKVERLKREKDPWERLDEIREFARQGHGSIPAEWLSTYFRFWGIYTQGDGAGAIGGKGGEGMAVPFFMVRIRIPNGFLSSDQARTIAALAARSPTAKIIDIGKRCGRKLLTQGEINSLLIFCAATAEVVVRLKGGDPCILGRAGEEIEALADAGIAFEIVPGITSAIAGAAAAGISLTDRRFASSVVFTTAHRGDGADAGGVGQTRLIQFHARRLYAGQRLPSLEQATARSWSRTAYTVHGDLGSWQTRSTDAVD